MSLNQLLKNTFNKYPLDHSLDRQAIKKFINLADPEVKEICKKIFNNTIHISFEKFLITFNNCIKHFLNFYNNKRPIFILIDTINYNDYKYKSNYWLYEYFKNFVKHKIIIINNIDNKLLKNNDTIVIIDDCSYTGLQIISTFEILKNKYKLKLNFYILVPFISSYAYNNFNLLINNHYISNFNKYYNIYYNKKSINILTCDDVLSNNEIEIISKFYNYEIIFYERFLIYFDHKLADSLSTITLFYNGLVPNKKNKIILNKFINKKNINYNELDIIPIIKNCKNYINNLDEYNPICPHPPYKSTFKDFIKEINKTKTKYNSL